MELVSAVLGPSIDKTVGAVGRQIGYAYHYTENIEKLRRKVSELGGVMLNVQRKIDDAKRRDEIVQSVALEWLRKAGDAKAEAEKFLEENREGGEGCFKGWRPNICSRYLLGREVKKKASIVVVLQQRGSSFQTVSQLRPLLSFSTRYGSSDYEGFESRKPAYEEIMKALRDEGTHAIGIYGMGGVGKTTMAVEVGAQAKKDRIFDEVVKVVVSQNPNVGKIQDELAELLNLKLEEKTEVGKAGRLHHRLSNGNRILLILDDVWKELNLKDVGIPFADAIKGCKILLTSRKQNVCSIMQVQKEIYIDFLSNEEAWSLFKQQVKKNTIDPPDMHMLGVVAREVCAECGCLPIALLAVGAALRDKPTSNWVDALEQMRTSKLKNIEGVDDKVCASLVFSYNNLDLEDAKPCLLFCCLFPEDFNIPIESILRYGKGVGVPGEMNNNTLAMRRNRIRVLVDHLKSNCLLLDGTDEEHVRMHDVVRDVAMSIASEGQHVFLSQPGGKLKEWPDRETYDCYTTMSLTFDGFQCHGLPYELECPKLHTLMLKYPQNIPQTFFNGMGKLRVLTLSNLNKCKLPPSIQNLVHLRVLSLENCCYLEDLYLVGKLKKLEMLILRGTGVNVLPKEIGDLAHLRLLDLRKCRDLGTIFPNVISRLSRLEELFMPTEFEFSRWGGGGIIKQKRNASLDPTELMPLSQLVSLEIDVPNLETWPFPFLGNLTHFKISINAYYDDDNDDDVEEYFKPWRTIMKPRDWKKVLKVRDVALGAGVDVLLKKAEVLYMAELNDLQSFSFTGPDRDGDSFDRLEYLDACCCKGVQEFVAKVSERPFASGHFCRLAVLKVRKCNLKYLLSASTARKLAQLLKVVEIAECTSLETIIMGTNEAAARRGREGGGGGGQEEESPRLVIFPRLERLTLQGLPKLVSFYSQTKQNCGSEQGPIIYPPVQPLFNEKVAFPKLEGLEIFNVGKFKEMGFHLPAQESFSKLGELRVGGMSNLSAIGSSALIQRLQRLQVLRLWGCGSLRAIFNVERRQTGSREEMDAPDHYKTAVVQGLDLPHLQELTIFGCPLLEEFCWACCSQSNSKGISVVKPSIKLDFRRRGWTV